MTGIFGFLTSVRVQALVGFLGALGIFLAGEMANLVSLGIPEDYVTAAIRGIGLIAALVALAARYLSTQPLRPGRSGDASASLRQAFDGVATSTSGRLISTNLEGTDIAVIEDSQAPPAAAP